MRAELAHELEHDGRVGGRAGRICGRHARCSRQNLVQADADSNRDRRPDGGIGIIAFDHDVVEVEIEQRCHVPG